MTKRAGRRKHRRGSQRHPPGKTHNPDSGLTPKQEIDLESKAIRNEWYLQGTDGITAETLRNSLMRKVITHGLQGTPEIAISALRVISNAELKQQSLQLQKIREERTVKSATGLPDQAPAITTDKTSQQPADPRQVAMELLRSAAIKESIDFSPRAANG